MVLGGELGAHAHCDLEVLGLGGLVGARAGGDRGEQAFVLGAEADVGVLFHLKICYNKGAIARSCVITSCATHRRSSRAGRSCWSSGRAP